jgi:malonyl-CoA/methylmalonyl-CoA synthetase
MPDNLFSALRNAAEGFEHKNFVSVPEELSITYKSFFELAGRYSNALGTHGVGVGDRVLSKTVKSVDALALYISCLQQGAVFIPVNPQCSKEEFDYLINDSDPTIVVLDAGQVFDSHVQIETIGPSGTLSDLALQLSASTECAETVATDVAVILYTSGTTGRPKGVMISHRALISNGSALNKLWGFSQSDILLHALPIFHVHGLFVAMHCAMLSGCEVIFLEKFSVSDVLNNLPLATVFMGVPTYYSRLLSKDEFTEKVCAGIRLFTSGSAPMTEQIHDNFHRRTRHRVLERYGMTEAGIITSNPLQGDRVPGSVGFALPGVQIRVSREGKECSPGETGIVEVAGEHLFNGYWRKPRETTEALLDDGFLITGDIGVLDDNGRLRLKGRDSDLIISGGENIYPKEIELHLDEIECIDESTVIGIPDEDLGERVIAVIVPFKNFDEQEVKDSLKGKITGLKFPNEFVLIAELPRNSMGKIQKSKLRSAYNEQS